MKIPENTKEKLSVHVDDSRIDAIARNVRVQREEAEKKAFVWPRVFDFSTPVQTFAWAIGLALAGTAAASFAVRGLWPAEELSVERATGQAAERSQNAAHSATQSQGLEPSSEQGDPAPIVDNPSVANPITSDPIDSNPGTANLSTENLIIGEARRRERSSNRPLRVETDQTGTDQTATTQTTATQGEEIDWAERLRHADEARHRGDHARALLLLSEIAHASSAPRDVRAVAWATSGRLCERTGQRARAIDAYRNGLELSSSMALRAEISAAFERLQASNSLEERP